LRDFETAGFRDEVKPLVLKDNAVRMLGLADTQQNIASAA